MKNTINLFVYGILKKGFRLHKYLKQAKFLGEDTIKGELYTNGYFPYLTFGEDDVHGEVYEINLGTYHLISRIEAAYVAMPTQTAKNINVITFFFPYKKRIAEWELTKIPDGKFISENPKKKKK